MPTAARSAPRSRKTLAIAAAITVFVIIALGVVSGLYTDLLWFREIGFSQVFRTQLVTKAELAGVFGLAFTVVLLINLWVVQRTTNPAHVFSMQDSILERYRLLIRPAMKRIVIGGAILLGFFAGSGAIGEWRKWLLFRNAQPFGEQDPVFHKDLGFFVFRLPFHRFVFTWAFSSLLIITLIVIFAHYLMGGIRTEGNFVRVAPHVKAHASVLLGLLVALKAWGYRLDQFGLNYSPRGGQVTGASYTDIHAQLPALKLLVVIAIVCSLLFLVNIRFRGWVLPAAGLGILLITSIIAGGIYPTVVQRFSVKPEERTKERPFIQRNIDNTRKAFALDGAGGVSRVEVKEQPVAGTVTSALLKQNEATVQNLRLWDPETLVDAYTQLQRITPYYEFTDVDVDRYPVGRTTRQVMLSAREVDPNGLPDQARTWVNNHLVYTHGYGAVASRVDTATPEGQPDFLISDIPPASDDPSLKLTEPRVYFGERDTERFVIAKSSVDELDFPKGDTGFESSSYKGKGGIQLSSLTRRLAFAWRFKDVNLLISNAIKPESRILFRRNVAERVQQVAPYLQLDGDPYVVVTNGRMVWMQDAYTTTANYPYAQRIDVGPLTNGHLSGKINYIRNSVKATVDAFDGTVKLYVWDETDPIIRAWQKVFPSLLLDKSTMPAELAAHVRYPEDMFLVQADRYATYHIKDPIDFYSKNDVWRIPDNPACSGTNPNQPASCSGTNKKMPPYYVMINLPGETKPEFVIMLPFSPFSGEGQGTVRQNLTSWLAARMDGPDNYGRLFSFVYGKDKNVFGPEQVDARIENDAAVRQEKTRLDPKNERIMKGNLLVIPIGQALLYVQPLYLRASSSPLPEFKRVVVATKDKIRIAESIADALEALVADLPNPGGKPSQQPPSATVQQLITDAIRHYQAGQVALQRGDFTAYGREQAAMKSELDRAQTILGGSSQSSPSPSPSPSPVPSK